MTSYVRWKPGTVAEYQYYEAAKAEWVDCPKEMVRSLVRKGPVHWNPKYDPASELTKAMQR